MRTPGQIWKAIQPRASRSLGSHVATHWLSSLEPLEIVDGVFRLETGTAFNRGWINERYGDEVLRLLRKEVPTIQSIEIIVADPGTTKEYPRPQTASAQQLDLFLPVLANVAPRDARDAMELPFVSLSKQKRTKPIIYGDPANPTIYVYAPEQTGIANIYDWDVIIYCAGHIRAALNAGKPVSPRVRIIPAEYLKFTGRHSGKAYQNGLLQSLRRLNATVIQTTIRTDDQMGSSERERGFHWINNYDVVKRTIYTAKGPKVIVEYYEVELCHWLFRAILNSKQVLSLDAAYFALDGGYERWLYRLVRKSAGRGAWTWTLAQLYERSGKGEEYKKFTFHIRNIVNRAQTQSLLPGYRVSLGLYPPDGARQQPALFTEYVSATEVPPSAAAA